MKSNACVRFGPVISLLTLVGLHAVTLSDAADPAASRALGQLASPRDVFRWSTLGSDFAAWPYLERSIKSVPRPEETDQVKRRVLLGKRPNDDDNNDMIAGGVSAKRKTMLGKREDGDRQPERLEDEGGSFADVEDKRRVMLGKRPELKSGEAVWRNYANRDDTQTPWQTVARLGTRPDSAGDNKRRILLGKRPDDEIAVESKRRILLGKRPSEAIEMKRTTMLGKRPDADDFSETKRRIMLGKRPVYDARSYMKRRILLGKRRVLPEQRQNSNTKPPAWQRTLLGKRAAVSGFDSNVGKGRVRLGRSQDGSGRQDALVKRPFGGGSYKWDLPSAPNVRDERR